MKKLVLVLGLLVAVGAGCVSLGKLGGQKVVEGKWLLAFDLPSSWMMTVPYQSPSTKAVVPSDEVERNDNEIYLQSTTKAIVLGGVAPDASVSADSYTNLSGNLLIKVSQLDPRRVIPSEAEDMGDGFSKVKLCEDGGECEIGGRYNYDYYLKTDTTNYKFVVYGDDINQAEQIITSAEVVTAAATDTK
ncbi:MAG TPA: hypothetical protein PLK06_02210 [bacterium]|nr:hypothetical protein [bacterium]